MWSMMVPALALTPLGSPETAQGSWCGVVPLSGVRPRRSRHTTMAQKIDPATWPTTIGGETGIVLWGVPVFLWERRAYGVWRAGMRN